MSSIRPLARPAVPRLGLFSAVALLACQPSAWAQQAVATTTLPPVKVSASAERDEASVKADELTRTQAKDARDALQGVAGVEVGGGGNAVAQKIYVRGLEDTMLHVTLDGAPQAGYIYHHQGRVQIDPALVKAIEVEKGTGSASAGPGALGGALRVVTKDATDLLREGQILGARIGAGVFSNDGWRGQLAGFGKIGTQLDALVATTRVKNENYKDGHGTEQATSASEQESLLAKLNWQLLPGHTLSLAHNASEDSGVRYLRPNMVGFPPGNNTPLPTVLQRDTTTLGYTYKGTAGRPNVSLSAFNDKTQNERTNGARAYGERLKGEGADLKLDAQVGGHRWKAGVNHHKLSSNALNAVNVGNPAYSNGADNTGTENSEVNGVYVEGLFNLNESLRLTPGLRYDRFSYTDNHNQTFESRGASPSLALDIALSDAWSVRAGYTEALRGAGVKEAFLLDNGPGPRIYRNRADLRPEKAHNVEFGAAYAGSGWGVRGSAYRQTINDYIGGAIVGPEAVRLNTGQLVTNGVELSGSLVWKTLQLAASVSHSRPRLNGRPLDDGDFSLGVTTGRSWRFSADYVVPGVNLIDVGWAMRSVESLSYVATGTTAPELTKAGYNVHDLHASWQPLGRDHLRLSLSVRNLFDKFYFDQATYGFGSAQGVVLGYPEPGRDVRLEASWQF